jgi:hypothetical protein
MSSTMASSPTGWFAVEHPGSDVREGHPESGWAVAVIAPLPLVGAREIILPPARHAMAAGA